VKFAANVASFVNPANTSLWSTSTTIGKNASTSEYSSEYFLTFLNQMLEYSSSNSKNETHSLDADSIPKLI
jgi:hypothetical protein